MKRNSQFGVFLIEVLIGLVFVGILTVWASNQYADAQNIDLARKSAEYNKALITAATEWIRNNSPTAKATATSTVPFVLDVPTLKAANLLNPGYSPKNRYNQTPCILILQPNPDKLAAMLVLEGGDTLDLRQQRRIAAFTPSGAITEMVGGVLTATGAAGIFSIPLTNYANGSCSGTPIGAGRVAAAFVFDVNTITAPFLYTTTVTGNPNANTMFTNLNMNNNNINNVATINATTINTTTLNADCFVSKSNPSYYVCPASNSVINTATGDTIAVNKLFGRTDSTYFITPDQTSNVNNLVAETLTARALYDKDNVAFFIDPAGNSTLRDAYVTNRRNDVRISNFFSNFVEKGFSLPMGDGGVVPAATCLDGGQSSIYLIPQDIYIPADLTIRPKATLVASNWVVKIRDGSNNPIPNSTYFAKLGCYFA